jgi:hypothetical protein
MARHAILGVLCVLFLCRNEAWGWGNDAHRLIAEQAERQLQPRVLAEVQRLLSAEPGATMGSVASWADENRTRTDAPWHYVNLPRGVGCRYEADRDCPDGSCVVGAIERQVKVLKSSAPDEQRLRALKFVIHFVGDVHQPLHAGHAEDRGGNTFQLQAFGRGTNLHSLWDTGLVVNWPGGVSTLRKAVEEAPPAQLSLTSPAAWAEESCRLVEQEWFYPRGHTLGDDYPTKAQPVVRERIGTAAARLAAVLNDALVK